MITLRAERHAALATALGISTAELQAYFDDGLTLREIAEDLGLDLESLDWPLGPVGRGWDDDFGPRGPRGGANSPADTTPNAEATASPDA